MLELSRNSISIMGFDIHFYGLLIALGASLGVYLAIKREKRLGLKKDTSIDLALICVPVAIVFARAYYVIFSWNIYRNDPISILNLRQGGLAIYGGIIGGALAGFVFSRIRHIPYSTLADLTAPSIALGQAIGRWGNFFNQEAYGRAVTEKALRFFPNAVYIEASGQWHYATFFYESAWCLLITLFLMIAEKKRFFKAPGHIFLWYACLYAAERAAVEGLRTDSLMLGTFRVSQLLSLAALIVAAYLLLKKAPRLIRYTACLVCAGAAFTVLNGNLSTVWSVLSLAIALTMVFVSYAQKARTI